MISIRLLGWADAFEMHSAGKPAVRQDGRRLVNKRAKVGAQAQKVLEVPAMVLPEINPLISIGFESRLL